MIPGAAAGSDPVLQLVDVSKTYHQPVTREVLSGVSLEVHPGDTCAIVGRSGSGKSTILSLMGLLDRPTSGQVFLGGVDVAAASERHRAESRATMIGFVFQAFHLRRRRTTLANVQLGLQYHPDAALRRSAGERAEASLAAVGLEARIADLAATLSGGESQRVAIARALVAGPAIVLADEPTGNLDATSAEAIVDLILNLAPTGVAVVLITHDEAIAARCGRRYRLEDGRLHPEGGR